MEKPLDGQPRTKRSAERARRTGLVILTIVQDTADKLSGWSATPEALEIPHSDLDYETEGDDLPPAA